MVGFIQEQVFVSNDSKTQGSQQWSCLWRLCELLSNKIRQSSLTGNSLRKLIYLLFVKLFNTDYTYIKFKMATAETVVFLVVVVLFFVLRQATSFYHCLLSFFVDR